MRDSLILIMVVVGSFFTNIAYSQEIAIKSNLLYDVSGTISLGLEYRLSEKMTIDVLTSNNPWRPNTNRNKRLNNILVQPEARYWFCESFNGHFVGAHAHYAYYNVGGDNMLLNSILAISTISKLDFKNYHRSGNLVGVGLSYGYHWILYKRWSLEGTVGLGYAYMDYNTYENPVCGVMIAEEIKHYFGLTKLGLSLVFMIK